MAPPSEPTRRRDELQQLVDTPPPGLAIEFWQFLRDNKKWWLVPILLALLLLGALAVISSSGLGPFIYPFV
ncbi:MAG: hypothetical protein KF861_06175 [Planctomycetaceae bacterium]|nr:hypothetical protein [Planctomycetaceae bacterium]